MLNFSPNKALNQMGNPQEILDLRAEDIIRNHVLLSLGAGFVPVPLLDLVAVSAVQLDMCRQLAKNYDIEFKEELGKSVISSIAGTAVARYGASLAKSIPGIGSILGGISMSALSGATTYAIGQVFKRHFGGGGDLFDFNLDRAKKIFEEELEKGKKVAHEIEKMRHSKSGEKMAEEESTEKASPSKGKEIFDQLERLAELRDKGVITDEEFQGKKDELLGML